MTYQPRSYRDYSKTDDLISFKVVLAETDLLIHADKDLKEDTEKYVTLLRKDLDTYIERHPDFLKSLIPVDIEAASPLIVQEMAVSAQKASVGPMAAVAGAFAETVGRHILAMSSQVIVENGGDIFISSTTKRIIGIYAGESRFNEKVGLEIAPETTPCGVCTSSGTVGHSLSLGKANAVIVVSESTPLADAAATSICNRVSSGKDIDTAIKQGQEIDGVRGIVIIVDDNLGVWGRVKLVDIQ